jgi:hypothetical protein
MKIGYPVFGGLRQPQDDQIEQGTNTHSLSWLFPHQDKRAPYC